MAPMQLAYNCHVHMATKETPFFLTYLHEPRLPVFDVEKPRKLYMDNYAAEAFNLAQAAHLRVRENLGEQRRKCELYFDKASRERSYKPGDKIIVHFPNVPQGVNQKFFTKWRPFTVTKMVGPVNVEARGKSRSNPILVHINRTRLLTPAETSSLLPFSEAKHEPSAAEQTVSPDRTESARQLNRACSRKGENERNEKNAGATTSRTKSGAENGGPRKARREAAPTPKTNYQYNLRPRKTVNLVYDAVIKPTQSGDQEDEEALWHYIGRPHRTINRPANQERASLLSGSPQRITSSSSQTSTNSDNDDSSSTEEEHRQKGSYGGKIAAPDTWLQAASKILPSVTPWTRSKGTVGDIPLPTICPVRSAPTGVTVRTQTAHSSAIGQKAGSQQRSDKQDREELLNMENPSMKPRCRQTAGSQPGSIKPNQDGQVTTEGTSRFHGTQTGTKKKNKPRMPTPERKMGTSIGPLQDGRTDQTGQRKKEERASRSRPSEKGQLQERQKDGSSEDRQISAEDATSQKVFQRDKKGRWTTTRDVRSSSE